MQSITRVTVALLSSSMQIALSCDKTQCADYMTPNYWPSMSSNPVLAIETVFTVHEIDRGGSKGVYAAHTISTRGDNGLSTCGGYFGTVVHSNERQGDNLLFSFWDKSKDRKALPMHKNCKRNCQDCSRDETTGTQCYQKHIGSIPKGGHVKFRMERGRWASTSYEGKIHKGYVWTVTASGFWNGVVGKMLFEESSGVDQTLAKISGITGIGQFHELLWNVPCDSFHVVESRDGPYPVDPELDPPETVDDQLEDFATISDGHYVQDEELLHINKAFLKHVQELESGKQFDMDSDFDSNVTSYATSDMEQLVSERRQAGQRQFLYMPILRSAKAWNHYTRGIKDQCRASSSGVCHNFNFYSDRPGRGFIATGRGVSHTFDDYKYLHLYDCPASGCQIPWRSTPALPALGTCPSHDPVADKGNAPCPSGSHSYGGSRKKSTCCCGSGCCWDNCNWGSPPKSCLPIHASWQSGINQWGSRAKVACVSHAGPNMGTCGNGGKVAEIGYSGCTSGSHPYGGSRSYTACCCGGGCCWDSCSWSSPPASCLPPGAVWTAGTDQWGKATKLACIGTAGSSATIYM